MFPDLETFHINLSYKPSPEIRNDRATPDIFFFINNHFLIAYIYNYIYNKAKKKKIKVQKKSDAHTNSEDL